MQSKSQRNMQAPSKNQSNPTLSNNSSPRLFKQHEQPAQTHPYNHNTFKLKKLPSSKRFTPKNEKIVAQKKNQK